LPKFVVREFEEYLRPSRTKRSARRSHSSLDLLAALWPARSARLRPRALRHSRRRVRARAQPFAAPSSEGDARKQDSWVRLGNEREGCLRSRRNLMNKPLRPAGEPRAEQCELGRSEGRLQDGTNGSARKANRELFLRGDYEALPCGEYVVAFTRASEKSRIVCCTPPFPHPDRRRAPHPDLGAY
jgi:hypothetical protein